MEQRNDYIYTHTNKMTKVYNDDMKGIWRIQHLTIIPRKKTKHCAVGDGWEVVTKDLKLDHYHQRNQNFWDGICSTQTCRWARQMKTPSWGFTDYIKCTWRILWPRRYGHRGKRSILISSSSIHSFIQQSFIEEPVCQVLCLKCAYKGGWEHTSLAF